jgi:dienelactone hydrolase
MKWSMLLFTLFSVHAIAKDIKVETVVYEKNGVKMEGQMVYDAKKKGNRPAVLVFHNWMGNNDYTLSRAKQLAEEGYIAFSADIYGQGVRPKDVPEASALATKYKNDRKLMRERANSALEALLKNKNVDKNKVVAIGYCFGGTVALEMARDLSPLAGVISFHGGLSTPMKASKVNTKVLVLHGADDPFVKDEEVLEFQKEMRDAKADWHMVSYGNSVHSFTEKAAGNDNSKGAAYNEKADKRSWQHMEEFLDEIF